MKRVAKIVCMVAAMYVILISCSGRKRHEYFRHATIDGRHELLGRYPVDSVIAQQINCYHFVYDHKGRPVKVEYLKRGNLAIDSRFGAALIEIDYWKEWAFILLDKWERWRFCNEDNDLIRNNDGVFSFYLNATYHVFSPNTWDVYSHKYNDVLDKNGLEEYMYRLDKDGRIISEKHKGTDDLWSSDSLGVFEYEMKYDTNGNLIEISSDGDTNGVFIKRFTYDEFGNRLETKYYDKNKNLVSPKDIGAPIVRYKYDENGYLIETSFYDEKGKPIEGKEGIAVVRREFNEMGDLLSERNYRVNGNLKTSEESGVTETLYEYDDQGNVLLKRYLGVNGQLVESRISDVAMACWVYNSQGKWTELSVYGVDGQLKNNVQGRAVCRRKYDEYGFRVEESVFDANGMRTEVSAKYALMRVARDKNHRIIEYSFYDCNEQLTSDWRGGYAIYTCKYDRWGNIIEERYFNPDGELMNNAKGIAVYTAKCDRHGLSRNYSYYDKDGKLLESY